MGHKRKQQHDLHDKAEVSVNLNTRVMPFI